MSSGDVVSWKPRKESISSGREHLTVSKVADLVQRGAHWAWLVEAIGRPGQKHSLLWGGGPLEGARKGTEGVFLWQCGELTSGASSPQKTYEMVNIF